ncbi:MAG: inactive transglutaminase family protein [Gammaproteobacteria bacterium]|nr:inactive transglutaminase family protein [Gammaproteobacteria bacterium]
MTNRAPFLFLVTSLIVVGVIAATFRHDNYGIPWLPDTKSRIWQVEARVEFRASGGPSQVHLTLPPVQSGFELVSESAASSGWGFTIDEGNQQRRAHWTQRDVAGNQMLFYKLNLAASEESHQPNPPTHVLPIVNWDEPSRTAARHLIKTVTPITAGPHTLAVQLIQTINRTPADQNVSLLTSNYAPSELLTRVLQTANVHARSVQLLELEDGRRRQSLVEYVQVWDGEQWRLYDPQRGEVVETSHLLLWQTGQPSVLEVEGGSQSRVSFSMISQTRSSLLLAQEQAGDLALSLYNLPIAEQSMFQLIMLLPVGALVVVLMRVLIGVRTSGTFMPVLIALAFLQTDLLPGLSSFIIVVAIGLFIRSYLSALNLLLVARIATLVLLVIAIISLFSIISYRLGLIQGLTITFFPMIILAWTIERMSIIWEEEGPKEVLIQGGGSLFVAILAFLLMDLAVVRHLAFNFPELHLLILAMILLAGRYTGYRLLELKRFEALRK